MDDTVFLWRAFGVALLCMVLTAFLYSVTIDRTRWKLPPGPIPWPIVGNIFSIGTHRGIHQTYAKMAERYGNIFTLYIGSARVVIVTNAAMAKEVLLVQDLKLASRPVHDLMYTCARYMNPGGDTSLSISLWSPKIRELRQICDRLLMAPRGLEATRSRRREEVWRTVGLIEKGAQAEKPIELRSVLKELALRLSCRVVFNKAFVGTEFAKGSTLSPEVFWKLDSDYSKLLATMNLPDVIPTLRLFGDIFGANKKWKAEYGSFLQITSRLTDWYKENVPDVHVEDESSLDFLEVLMQKVKEGTLNEAMIKELNTEVLMAGTDTIAVTLEWFMLELMRHPHVMQKLRAEIDGKYGDSSPVDEESSIELPYLQAVLKEVLRLHHPAPLSVPHYATENVVIGGYTIPAGTSVITDIWAIGRDPEQWGPDALEFNPDRYCERDVNVTGTIDFGFIPFSAGRRVCPGRQVAVRTISTAIAALVHAFDWEALPGDELSTDEAVGGLNCRNINPLVLQPRLRSHVSLYH